MTDNNTDTNQVAPLKMREKIGYSFGDFASNLFWMSIIYFGMFFYTDVFGITVAAASVMLGITHALDFVFDPVMGIVADRTSTRWGKYRPFLLFMAVPFALLGLLSFTTPDLSMGGKLVWAYATHTLFMITYSAINLPYSALMGVLTPSVKDRTKIATIRFAAAFAGGIFVSLFTIPLVGMFGDESVEVVQIASNENHRLVIEEQNSGTVQIKVDFAANPPDETGKPAWLKTMDNLFISSGMMPEKNRLEDKFNVWVNTPEKLAEIRVPKADKDKSPAEKADADFQDGNFYLTKGFGKKEIDLRALFATHDRNDENGVPKENWEPGNKSVRWEGDYRVSIINQQEGFMFTFGVYALIALSLFVLTFFVTKERVAPPKDQHTNIGKDLKNVLSSKAWVIVSIMSLFTLMQVCIRGGAIMYYFKYYVGNTDFAGPFILAGTITNLVGTLLVPLGTRIAGSKKKLYIFTVLLQIPTYIAFFFLAKDQFAVMFLLTLLGGLLSGPMSPIVWAMYADTADHSEWKTGIRATGLFFSAASLMQKVGWAVGGAVAGALLALANFTPNTLQAPETINMILVLMSWVPAVGCFISAGLMVFYPLDEKLMATVEKDLKERRAAADAA